VTDLSALDVLGCIFIATSVAFLILAWRNGGRS